MRLYLDHCALQRPLDDQRQVRIRVETEIVLGILTACRAGDHVLVTSAAHVIEASLVQQEGRRERIDALLRVSGAYIETTEEVGETAGLFVGGGLRPLDALHLASAVVAGVDVFCTTDDRFFRRAVALNTRRTLVVQPPGLIPSLPAP